MLSRVIPLMVFAGVATILSGCASDPGPKPDNELDTALQAVEEADAAGATNEEPAMMTDAREKLEKAQELMAEENYAEARRLLEKAAVDARLAETRAQTQAVRSELGNMKSSIDSLRRNLEAEE